MKFLKNCAKAQLDKRTYKEKGKCTMAQKIKSSMASYKSTFAQRIENANGILSRSSIDNLFKNTGEYVDNSAKVIKDIKANAQLCKDDEFYVLVSNIKTMYDNLKHPERFVGKSVSDIL